MKIAFFSFLMKNKDYGTFEDTPKKETLERKVKITWGAYKCFFFYKGKPWLTIGPHCII